MFCSKRLYQIKKRADNTLYLNNKEAARVLIHDRLKHYNRNYGFTYHRVAIRDQRHCWGSCSTKANLNFSYKLLFLPTCLSDYVILHELCHLREFNHSAEFWSTMAEVMFDYKDRANTLRQLERTHGTAVHTLKRYRRIHTCDICCIYTM